MFLNAKYSPPGSEEIVKDLQILVPHRMRKLVRGWRGGWRDVKDVVEEKTGVVLRRVEGTSPPADPYDWDKRSSLEGKTVDQ